MIFSYPNGFLVANQEILFQHLFTMVKLNSKLNSRATVAQMMLVEKIKGYPCKSW